MSHRMLFGSLALLWVSLSCASLNAQRAERNGEIINIDQQEASFTVRTARGETSVLTNESTVFKEGDRALSFSDLQVGDQVQVVGTRQTGPNVLAQTVTRLGQKD